MLHLDVEWVSFDTYYNMEKSLDSGEIDLIGATYAQEKSSIDRWAHYTSATFSYGAGMVVKTNLKSNSSQHMLFSNFTVELWLTMLVTTVAVVSLKIFLSRLQLQSKFTSLIYAFWFLILSIILNFYGNLIAVDLLIPDTVEKPPFESIEDLAEKLQSSQCRFVMLSSYKNSTEFYDNLLKPTHRKPWSNALRSSYQTNPPVYVSDRDELIKLVRLHKCWVGIDYIHLSGISYYSNYCSLKFFTFPDEIPFTRYSYYLKNSTVGQLIDNVITTDAFYAYTMQI